MKAKGPGESVRLLLEVTTILAANEVNYAVVGALAASVHGVVRATLDADALIAVGLPTLRKLDKAFRTEGLSTELRRGDNEDPIPALLVLTDDHGNRVDLLCGLRGLDPQAFRRCFDVPFQKGSLRVIGLEDFVAMKCFAGGPQDIEDARHALRLNTASVDVGLVRRLVRRFGARGS